MSEDTACSPDEVDIAASSDGWRKSLLNGAQEECKTPSVLATNQQPAELHNATQRMKRASLLGLPRELRDRIYQFALAAEGPLSISGTKQGAKQPALSRVARGVRSEALDSFYRSNKFWIQLWDFDHSLLSKWWNCPSEESRSHFSNTNRVSPTVLNIHVRGSANWQNLMHHFEHTYPDRLSRVYYFESKEARAEHPRFCMIGRLFHDMKRAGCEWREVKEVLTDCIPAEPRAPMDLFDALVKLVKALFGLMCAAVRLELTRIRLKMSVLG